MVVKLGVECGHSSHWLGSYFKTLPPTPTAIYSPTQLGSISTNTQSSPLMDKTFKTFLDSPIHLIHTTSMQKPSNKLFNGDIYSLLLQTLSGKYIYIYIFIIYIHIYIFIICIDFYTYSYIYIYII